MTTETREHIERLRRLADAAERDGRWKTANRYDEVRLALVRSERAK